jgi:hypothetical protein
MQAKLLKYILDVESVIREIESVQISVGKGK